MNKNWILYVLLYRMFVSSVYSEGTEDPLIFDPYTLQIYTLENISSSSHEGPFVVACPAETDEQKKFTKKNSLDGKALYVRFTYHKQNPNTNDDFKCKETYRMAVVYHKSKHYGKLLEFGYEVYYQRDRFEKDFVEKDFNFDYGRAQESFSKWRRFQQFFGRDYLPSKFIKKFVWIPKVMFQYSNSNWSVKWVSRVMSWKVDQFQKTCNNDDLGIKLFRLAKGKKYSDFYSKESQNKIFSELQLPESVDGICKSDNHCVKEYNILAPYIFETPISSGSIECSNLTTIPIWYTRTKELLDYTEKFAIALSQTVGNIVRELTGVYGELSFSRKNQRKPKPKPVYLDSKNGRLPVPKVIYKIVTSTTADCDRFISTCRYAVVIVIHNGPQILPGDELCKDGCAEWGWDSIQYLSTTEKKEKSSFVYCCKLDENMRKKLNYPKKKSISGVLDLKSFKNHKGKGGLPNRENPDIQKEVEGKMNELFGL